MPRFEKNGRTIETSIPSYGVRLKADGWKETKARTKRVKQAEAEETFDNGGTLKPAKPVTNDSAETEIVVHPDAANAPVEPVSNE